MSRVIRVLIVDDDPLFANVVAELGTPELEHSALASGANSYYNKDEINQAIIATIVDIVSTP